MKGRGYGRRSRRPAAIVAVAVISLLGLGLAVPASSWTWPVPRGRALAEATITAPLDGERVDGATLLVGDVRSDRTIEGVEIVVRDQVAGTYWNASDARWQSGRVGFDAQLGVRSGAVVAWSSELSMLADRPGSYRITAAPRLIGGLYPASADDRITVEVATIDPEPPTTTTEPPTTTTEPTTTTTEPTTTTTEPPTTTTEPTTTTIQPPPTTTTTAPGPGDYQRCRHPAGAEVRTIDFVALAASGSPVERLNEGWLDGGRTFVRTVFELDADRMSYGPRGLELSFDVGIPGPLDYRYRAEMRETIIDTPIPVGTTQAYCMRFTVDTLPDLYGPVEIFQRFNRTLDGPDLGVELTGANQFSNAVPNDLQVVAFDGRHRIGTQLDEVNTLLVVVHNHPTNGSYKVVLNGRVLREAQGIDTVGSPQGGWAQFGLYPHGLYGDDGPNRQDQIDSGRTSVRFDYADFTLVDIDDGSPDLSGFTVGP